MKLLFVLLACVAGAQTREDLLKQQSTLNAARHATDVQQACKLYQAYIDRYGGDAVWDELAQRGLFASLMEQQAKAENWASAEQLGAAAVKEIDTRRMPDSIAIRRYYAQALEHRQKSDDAAKQRARLEALAKAELLAGEIHEAAPPLSAKSIDGREISLAGLRGKIVIVAFWATWCAPCIDELGELNRAYPQLRERAEILAVNTDDTAQAAAGFARKHGYLFPVLKSEALDWPVSTIPRMFVIDGAGVVRFRFEGFEGGDLFAKQLGWMMDAIARH